jgi:hypothetical protein
LVARVFFSLLLTVGREFRIAGVSLKAISISSSNSALAPVKRLDSAAAPNALRLDGESGSALEDVGSGVFPTKESTARPELSACPQLGQSL